jgi:hypothetical protein
MSVRLTDDWNLIARPVLQFFNSTPFQDASGQAKRVTAFGDTALALAVSPGPRLVRNWLLAAGPTFIFPTATNSLIGQDKWQVGPAAAAGYKGKNFITYVFPQQWFSVGGNGRRTSHMLLYYAFVWVYSNGWSVGTNPGMFVDWEAASGNRVAFPVGLQVGKVRKLGPLPVKFDVQVQYYAVRPQVNAPKWNLQFQITPILPSLIKRKVLPLTLLRLRVHQWQPAARSPFATHTTFEPYAREATLRETGILVTGLDVANRRVLLDNHLHLWPRALFESTRDLRVRCATASITEPVGAVLSYPDKRSKLF